MITEYQPQPLKYAAVGDEMKVNFTLRVGIGKELNGVFDGEKVIQMLEAYAAAVADNKEICGFIMVSIKRGDYVESRYTEHFSDGKQATRACNNICNTLSVIY